MSFKIWFYLVKVVPLFILFVFFGQLSKNEAISLMHSTALIFLVILGIIGAIMGFMLAFGHLRMICPFCGIGGQPSGNKKYGFLLDCQNCGLVHGSGFLKLKLAKGNNCVDWPVKESSSLTIIINPMTINGVKFHSTIDEAILFGKPEVVNGVDGDITLNYLKNGLVLEYKEGRLIYIGVIIRPQDDISALPKTVGARVTLVGNEKTNLTKEIKPEIILQIFGKPEIDDVDSEERVITHFVDGITVESEFTSEGKLKRFNLFPK